jgi:hypothetical protein
VIFSVVKEIRSADIVETLLMIKQKDMNTKKQIQSCYDLYHGKDEIQGQAEN